jgi:hypothetical protein
VDSFFFNSAQYTLCCISLGRCCLGLETRVIIKSSKKFKMADSKKLRFSTPPIHTGMLYLICRHRYFGPGISTYMKVILTKNLTFITIIYHTKFQFAKISGTMKKDNFFNFCDIYVPFIIALP